MRNFYSDLKKGEEILNTQSSGLYYPVWGMKKRIKENPPVPGWHLYIHKQST